MNFKNITIFMVLLLSSYAISSYAMASINQIIYDGLDSHKFILGHFPGRAGVFVFFLLLLN